jgi:predicted secreted protein
MAAPAYLCAPAPPVPTSPPQQWATDNRPSQPQNLPKSHLVWAVFSIFFCFPFGIVALINANKVSTLWALGKYDEAQSAADSAKKFALWGTIVWAICIGGFFILGVVLPILFGLSVLGSSTSTPTYTTP